MRHTLRDAALLAAACLAFTLAAGCGEGTGSSLPQGASSQAGAASGEPTARPADYYAFHYEALEEVHPDFSVDAVDTGDPGFQPGSRYKGKAGDFRKADDPVGAAMWVWDAKVILGKDPELPGVDGDTCLDFLIANRITHIFLAFTGQAYSSVTDIIEGGGKAPEGNLTEMQLRGFIKKCSRYGIRVSSLVTSVQNAAITRMERMEDKEEEYYWMKAQLRFVADFNSRAKGDDEKLASLHIDFEPSWEYGEGKKANLQLFADQLITMKKYADAYGVSFGFDVFAWFEEKDTVIDEQGQTVCILDVLTKTSSEVAVMAYRRSATLQYEISQTALRYAVKNGCAFYVGAETGEKMAAGEETITYWPLGVETMSSQQRRLIDMLKESGGQKLGIAIHHLSSFYNMCQKKS